MPLDIANGLGWQILSPCDFGVIWKVGMAVEHVVVRADEGALASELPVSFFGQATFTSHIHGIFSTPSGWNLWVSGAPNAAKDGVSPLAGIIETDWSPHTFTMNWKLTRSNQLVRSEVNAPCYHIFPIEREIIEPINPIFVPLESDPELKGQFEEWTKLRNAFCQQTRDNPPSHPADTWQKSYYRDMAVSGECPINDHQSKLKVEDFATQHFMSRAPAVAMRTSQHDANADAPPADARQTAKS